MKPESLQESDPINRYLATKPKKPVRIPEEEPNGNYGLIINGYSLVGNTELQPCSLPPRNFSPRSSPLRGNFKTHESPHSPSFQVPLPDKHLSQAFSRLE